MSVTVPSFRKLSDTKSVQALFRECALFALLLLLTHLSFHILDNPVGGFLEDDAYFYAQLAYNMGAHSLPSFDGLYATDGFHMLWGYALGFLAKLGSFLGLSKDWQFKIMLAVYFYGILLFARTFAKNGKEAAMYLVLAFTCSLLMETLLLSLCILFLARGIQKEQEPSLMVAVALFLMPLARVDSVAIALCFLTYYIWKRHYTHLKVYAFALVLGLCLHFFILYLTAGHLLTVSSLVESQHSWRYENIARNLQMGIFVRLAIFFALAALATAALTIQRRTDLRDKKALLLFILVMQIVCYLYVHPNLRGWYLLPGSMYFLSLALEGPLLVSRRLLPVFVLLVFCVISAKRINNYYKLAGDRAYVDSFIRLTEKTVPEGEKILQVDGSGYVGFHLDKPILINGDGLVNTHDYKTIIQNNNLKTYLEREGIRYLIVNHHIEDIIFDYYGVTLHKEDVDIIKAPSASTYRWAQLGLYRIKEGVL